MFDDDRRVSAVAEETKLFGVVETSTINFVFSSDTTNSSNARHGVDVELDDDAWFCGVGAEIRHIIHDIQEIGVEKIVFANNG